MPWTDAFKPVEEMYGEKVKRETFGHLAPEKNKVYRAEILFTLGEYGDYAIIRAKIEGLDDSPWLFDDMMDFMCEEAKEEGCVYRFHGTYRNRRFRGKVEKVDI
jgi:hypothetical protein